MSDFIAIDITGEKEVAALLDKLPIRVGNAVVDDVSKYLINVYRTYPPFTHVTRKAAYGRSFQSARQRRYFFAALKQGKIKPPSAANRTQEFRGGWQQIGKGMSSIIANETPYGVYLMDDNKQARLSKMAGWKTVSAVIKDRWDRIQRIIEGTTKRMMK